MSFMWAALGLSLVAVAYNNAINRWEPFHTWAYLPINLAFAGGMTAVVMRASGVSWRDIFGIGELPDLFLPTTLVAGFAVLIFAIATSGHGHRIADARIAHLSGAALAFYVLVRIPVGTAVTEEVVFRGVLFAAWSAAGVSTVVAAVCSSVAFGLWHIAPTIIGIRMNDPAASRRKVWLGVVGAVVFTTLAGLGLTWVRVWSGGLVAPIVLHAGINSVGAVGALRARRGRGPTFSGLAFRGPVG